MNEPSPRTVKSGQQAVRVARATDQKFLTMLAKRFADQIGFISREAVDWYIDSGNVDIAIDNGSPAGFLLSKLEAPMTPGIVPVFQAAICYDAQRRSHALYLVEQLVRRAQEARKNVVTLWCRAELDANHFWAAADFVPVAIRSGGKSRGYPHICWRRALRPAEKINSFAGYKRYNVGGNPLLLDRHFGLAELLKPAAGELAIEALKRLSLAPAVNAAVDDEQPLTGRHVRQPSLFQPDAHG